MMSSELREKYLKIARDVNLDEAITKLHNYLRQLEEDCYVGGFNEEKFKILEELRTLSRELWDMRLDKNIKKTPFNNTSKL